MDEGCGPDRGHYQSRTLEKGAFFHFSTGCAELTGELSGSAPFDRGGQTRKVHFSRDVGEGRVPYTFIVIFVDHVVTLASGAKEIRSKQHTFWLNSRTEEAGS